MLELCASESCFQIDITDPMWCKCWLKNVNGKMVFLGAEGLKYLRDHLLLGLDKNNKEFAGSWRGHSVWWVLSLAEAHHTLYAAMENDDRILLWQNPTGDVICVMRASRTQYSQWQTELGMLK